MATTKTDDPIRVGVRELRGNLSAYLRQIRQGKSVLVLSRDEIIAELRPPPAPLRSARRPGALRGKLHMAADFDTLPGDILAAMEAEPDPHRASRK